MNGSSKIESDLTHLFLRLAGAEKVQVNTEKKDGLRDLEERLIQCLSNVPDGKQEMAQVERQRMEAASLNVAVIATMSAGKSTLLNALLGTELLPSSVAATTAKIISIEDCDGMTDFKFQARNSEGMLLSEGLANLESLQDLNLESSVTSVQLQGDITWVDNELEGRVVLFDTPGPNAYREDDHRNQFQQYLSQSDSLIRPDLLLYVMDATKLQVEDDHNLLSTLIDNLSQLHLGFGQLCFVVNKIDQLDEENGESVRGMIDRIRTYLKQEFDIPSCNIFPVSAMVGLLTTKRLTMQPMRKKERRQLTHFLTCFSSDMAHVDPIPNLYTSLFESEVSDEDALRILYQRSGMRELQQYIKQYLQESAREMRLVQAGLWLWNHDVLMPNDVNDALSQLMAKHF